MTTKNTYAIFAIVAVAIGIVGYSPAFADSATTTITSSDVDTYDSDVGTLYVGDVCNTNNTHFYKHEVTNWGSDDKVETVFYTNNNGNCTGLDKVEVKIYVNSNLEASWETTAESAAHTFRDVSIPDQNNNTVETKFLVYW